MKDLLHSSYLSSRTDQSSGLVCSCTLPLSLLGRSSEGHCQAAWRRGHRDCTFQTFIFLPVTIVTVPVLPASGWWLGRLIISHPCLQSKIGLFFFVRLCQPYVSRSGVMRGVTFLDTQVSLAPTHVSPLVRPSVGPSVRWSVTLSDFQSLVALLCNSRL